MAALPSRQTQDCQMSARRPMLIAAMAGVSLMLGGAAMAG